MLITFNSSSISDYHSWFSNVFLLCYYSYVGPRDNKEIPGLFPYKDIEVPSRVDGKRRNLARVSDFVSWDEACRVPRHKITHELGLPFTQQQGPRD